jgi:hypothetical protein
MALAKDCRHLEVQLLADEHGQAIGLYGVFVTSARALLVSFFVLLAYLHMRKSLPQSHALFDSLFIHR